MRLRGRSADVFAQCERKRFYRLDSQHFAMFSYGSRVSNSVLKKSAPLVRTSPATVAAQVMSVRSPSLRYERPVVRCARSESKLVRTVAIVQLARGCEIMRAREAFVAQCSNNSSSLAPRKVCVGLEKKITFVLYLRTTALRSRSFAGLVMGPFDKK